MTQFSLAFAQNATAAAAADPAAGGPGWIVAVNLVIWTGLFLYLVRLERRLGRDAAKEGPR